MNKTTEIRVSYVLMHVGQPNSRGERCQVRGFQGTATLVVNNPEDRFEVIRNLGKALFYNTAPCNCFNAIWVALDD